MPVAAPPSVPPSAASLPVASSSQIPHGVGLPPPPGMDPRKGKLMCIKVRLLDDTTAVFHLGHKANGQALFDEVCRHLNLLESDYFGLEFIDGYGNKVWLDKEKSILRQITSTQSDARFFFIVKFYTPNPADLEEEYTRYLISLQIRRDLASGEFVCNENTAAMLVAYIVQADCGDFSPDDYPDHTYLSPISFIPHQTGAFQIKVMENHKQLVGMTPGEADLALLEVARRCDFYGIKLHIARDIEGTDVNLSVAHMGVRVFSHLQCVSIFSWAKVRKLSFKRKRLMIKLHPESNISYKETVEFVFDTRNECKNFWKKCVEHHAFFRCQEIAEPRREKKKLFTRGSSFRYHGRTQKQLIDYVREHHKRREPFSRPIRPSANRSDSAQRHIQFNVMDATGSLGRPAKQSANGYGANPVYYPPGATVPGEPQQRHRPKSVVEAQTRPCTSYASEYERTCVSDVESSYVQQRAFKAAKRPEPIAEVPQPDPMSVSLPNVLGDDIKIVCREFELQQEGRPPKSASGDNFLEQVNNPNATFDYYLDNMSEGSYKLHDLEPGGVASSSQSDVGSAATDPRVYATTFTTKRVGNVIVKRIQPAHRHRSDDDGDDSSTYSDYPQRAKSVPSARYAHVMRQNIAAGGMARLRDAVPVAIDGPEATPFQPPTSQPSIIRPIVLSPAPPTQPETRAATIQQLPSVTTRKEGSPEEPKYSVVTRIRQPPPAVSTFAPVERESAFRSIASERPPPKSTEKEKEPSPPSTGIAATYGATGPVRGKVIHRDNILITPDGITVREAVQKLDRPAIPPKPKLSPIEATGKPKSASGDTAIPVVRPSAPPPTHKATPPPVPSKPKLEASFEASFDKLLEPLDSILKDAENLTILSQGKQYRGNRPALISVQSEDRPDVQKLHLLNGEIPYTLTMRNLDSGHPHTSTASTSAVTSTSASGAPAVSCAVGVSEKQNVDVSKHYKSLDLVHRRRLPSQDSFSSQDHSISPTTPDAGNVLDYVARRRSLSSDRHPVGRRSGRTRNDPRRQTQPVVRFGDTAIVTVDSPSSDISAVPISPLVCTEVAVVPPPPPLPLPVLSSSASVGEEEADLPAPPSVALLCSPHADVRFADESTTTSKENSSDEKLNETGATTRTDSGLLWTDF